MQVVSTELQQDLAFWLLLGVFEEEFLHDAFSGVGRCIPSASIRTKRLYSEGFKRTYPKRFTADYNVVSRMFRFGQTQQLGGLLTAVTTRYEIHYAAKASILRIKLCHAPNQLLRLRFLNVTTPPDRLMRCRKLPNGGGLFPSPETCDGDGCICYAFETSSSPSSPCLKLKHFGMGMF